MIKVIARSKIKKGFLPEALELYRELVAETRKEEGCISYELFEELDHPHSLTLMEEWTTMNALHFHTQTPHFTHLVGKLSKIETELPVLIYKKLF